MAVDTLLSSLLFVTPLVHLLVSPYTKVEESFNLQATHDILVYGTPTWDIHERLTSNYDHFTFSGAVPRTFIGPVVLAAFAQPVVALVGFVHAQFVVRALLGCFNALALLVFKRRLAAAYGADTARWWVVLTVTQFHVMYYLTRTLPNMFAFALSTLSLALLLPSSSLQKSLSRTKQSLCALVLAGVIFRGELAILVATTSLCLLYAGRISLRNLVKTGLVSFVGALAMSVPIDSYFWQRPLWPELAGFYFNAVQGSSSEWGTSPWHYYFSSALPRALLNPLSVPLIVLAATYPGTKQQTRSLVTPSLLYVAIYSLQPHKETRFMFYVIPALTAAAAQGANVVFSRRTKSTSYAAASALLCLSVLASLAASGAMLGLSSLNYPGGEALAHLYELTWTTDAPDTTVWVYADVLTCMTGQTLFGQNKAGVAAPTLGSVLAKSVLADRDPSSITNYPLYMFDRTEKKVELGYPTFWELQDYALMEDPAIALGKWDILGATHGFAGIEVLRPGQAPQAVEHKPIGSAERVFQFRDVARRYTGGWWVGPRMMPKIYIMKQKPLVVHKPL